MLGLSSLYMKLIGAGAIVLLIVGLSLNSRRWEGRAHRSEAENALVCGAARIASNRPKLDCKQAAEQIKFLGDALNAVEALSRQAKADDAAHAKLIETNQIIAGKETSNDYETKLARARADYAELLRRTNASATNSSRSGKSSVSGAATTPNGPSPTAEEGELPPADALTATEQALQLQAILDWGAKVGIISQ